MIRSSKQNQTIYREVLKHAFHTAWHDWRFWILSFLSGFLITAGAYDVMWRAVNSITASGSWLTNDIGDLLTSTLSRTGGSTFQKIISVIGGVEVLMLLVTVILAGIAISCIAQGALVFALGAKRLGSVVSLRDALKIGGKALWPVMVLNLVVLAVLWILRFLGAMPLYLALENTTAANYMVYLVSFMIFVPLSFLIAVIHIFALNAMILQGASLAQAVERGYTMFKKNWVVVIETAVIQAGLSVLIWFACVVALVILMIPSFILLVAASAFQSGMVFSIAIALGGTLLVAALLIAAAFTIQLQYATWTYLYRRLGEGGVIPKLHRIVRNLSGHFSVPQS